MKLGYQGSYQRSLLGREANATLMRYTFNGGLPTSVSYYIAPRWEQNDRTSTTSLYAQDQWTIGRLTLQGALRYDRAWSWSPAEHNGTSTWSPFLAAPVTFPRTASVDAYNDISTRLGGAWDVFGNGKTALKANLGRYLQNATNQQNDAANNPAARIVKRVGGLGVPSRGWVDGNGNYVVDRDLNDPDEQNALATGGDRCAALSGLARNFGSANPDLTIINPDILRVWGVRPADWQFGVSVEQELKPRVSIDVGDHRRGFQNFSVVDNQLVGPADYDPWTFTAPQHPDLPGGGDYAITQYALTREAALRGAQNYQTFETDFGRARTQYWHGVDISANARLRNGLTTDPAWEQIRRPTAHRSMPIHRCPTPSSSNRSAGCPGWGCPHRTRPSTWSPTASLYPGDRVNQVDMRSAKIVRFSGMRADIGIDLYNLFNTNDGTAFDQLRLRRRQRGGMASPDNHRGAAVRQVQRDVHVLAERAMQSRWRMVFGVVIAWLSANPVTASDAVSVSVSPTVAHEPAQITVRVSIEPNPDNRALEVVADSATFFRRSYLQLEGDRAARIRVFQYRDLPAGDYDVRAVLIAVDGSPGSTAVAKMKIRP